MLGWITDAIRRWRRQRSRAVFRFFDGRRTRAVDPWGIYVALETHPKYKHDLAEFIRQGSIEETEIAVSAASEVFGVSRFKDDPNGLTDGELVELLATFVLYTNDSKKKYDRLSTSLPATDGEFSNAATPSERTGTFSTDSGCASTMPKHATPSASSVA